MTNSGSEKVRKHWIWYALIVLSAVVGGTWKVAHELYVKPREDEIQRLTRRIAELEKIDATLKNFKEEPDIQEKPTTPQESRKIVSVKEDSLLEKPNPYSKSYDRLFQKGNPYPGRYDKVRLGMRLSVMKQMYPSAEYHPGWSTWNVKLPDSPFKFVRYGVGFIADSSDPKITWIEYYFTDRDARKQLTNQALLAFGSDTVKSEMLGEELEWSDIGGG